MEVKNKQKKKQTKGWAKDRLYDRDRMEKKKKKNKKKKKKKMSKFVRNNMQKVKEKNPAVSKLLGINS